MDESWVELMGRFGVYAPLFLGAIGSILGCAIGGQAACGAMLDVESGYGRLVGVSALPSSQTIYGIVVMLSLKIRERERVTLYRIGCARGTGALVQLMELLIVFAASALLALVLAWATVRVVPGLLM